MVKTFLSELANNKAFAILDDRIYEISDKASDRLRYINIGGVKKGLIESEMMIKLENRFMRPRVLEVLESTKKKKKKEEKEWI